jgi:hypothetical protein
MKLHATIITLDDTMIIHGRQVYSLWDFIGALGGSMAVIAGFWSIFVGSLPRNTFIMKAISKLFLVWPYDRYLLKPVIINPRSNAESHAKYKIN